MNFLSKIQNYQSSGYSALFVLTHEENRLIKDIISIREKNPELSIHTWDMQNGLQVKSSPETQPQMQQGQPTDVYLPAVHPEDTKTSSQLLDYIQNYRYDNSIFILQDFHLHFDKVINIRLLRNAWNRLKRRGNMIVFVGHKFAVPAELQKEIQLLDYDLPKEEAILERLMFIRDSVNAERKAVNKADIVIPTEIIEGAIEAAKGMTHVEVENAFALAYTSTGRFDSRFVDAVFQEKIAQLKKNGLLTYMEPNISFENVGGLQGLKTWLTGRKKAYSKEAREYNLPLPKGMLLASVPGTGKSLICKAIAKEFDCPLFALDIGSVFDSLVGNSEKNMREIIKTIESIGKCVVLID
jgi:hypothetical protein